jgi:hypothetical protein
MRAEPLRIVLVLGLAACGSASTTPSGTKPPAVTSVGDTITVDPSSSGPTISSLVLGANMAMWYDITQPGVATAIQTAGFAAARWPGGSESDSYYWKRNVVCSGGGYTSPNSTFDHFMADVAQPAHLDVAVTLNYGSDSTCTLPGDPAVAAAWVAYARTHNYQITHWTVGNESYGHWETDLHANQWDPTTYAAAVKNGYYPQIKTADNTAQVGVVVSGGGFNNWDQTVLANAPYDYVELHYYDQNPGSESDTGLILHGAGRLATAVQTVETELSQAGKAGVPIYVGELGSVNTNPGKQTMSITQALYAAQAIGTLMQLGVPRATWWLAFGGCNTSSSGNFSSSLYGWQTFAGYMILSDGIPTPYECTSAPNVPLGTLLPTARAYQVLSQFSVTGEHMVGVSLGDSLPTIRAWAATSGSGYALLLVNVDSATTKTVPVSIKGRTSGPSVAVTTYGKAQYDDSRNNIWTGPVQSSGGAWNNTFAVTLPPWSITVVRSP